MYISRYVKKIKKRDNGKQTLSVIDQKITVTHRDMSRDSRKLPFTLFILENFTNLP